MHHIKKARRLSVVKRWAIVPTVQTQSVAEHTFQVIILSETLGRLQNLTPQSQRQLFVVAMDHDLDEAVKGDPPGGPMKGQVDWANYVREKGKILSLVKLADLLEAYLFLKEEVALGNAQVQTLTPWYGSNICALANEIGGWPPTRENDLLPYLERCALGFSMGDYNV